MVELYQGSHQQYEVIRESNIMSSMNDGTELASDIYFPAIEGHIAKGKFPVLLERTPYNKASSTNVTNGKYFARRGYVCVIQDVRGRFRSQGEWYPFAKEAHDGCETVEWLAKQSWSNGKVGTMGASYAGSDQSALATLNPSHLTTMIIAVGASNYYHSSMRQNGALEQRFLIYIYRMAITSKEAELNPKLRSDLIKTFTQEMPNIIANYPLEEGSTILHNLPSYERWALDIQTHGEYDDYWKQRGYAMSEYYDQHADVPSLYLGGWYDSYARNTCESYLELRKSKNSPQNLLMGPWTHGKYQVPYSGDFYFGIDAQITYMDLKLAWFDYHLKGLRSEVVDWKPVKIFTMGTGSDDRTVLGAPGDGSEYPGRIDHGGYWREEEDWPLPGTSYTPYYLHGSRLLSPDPPQAEANPSTSYTYDPKDPVPTIGGGISAADTIMKPGAFNQSGSPDFIGSTDTLPLTTRQDILTFQTPVLKKDTEITGPIEMHLWASSSALDTDFTAKLIDVYPTSENFADGLAFNITDSIIRARYRNGWDNPKLLKPNKIYEFVFELYPTSTVFRKGHRIRLDISSSNWPRFDANPNTGGELGIDRTRKNALQTIYHSLDHASNIILPIQS